MGIIFKNAAGLYFSGVFVFMLFCLTAKAVTIPSTRDGTREFGCYAPCVLSFFIGKDWLYSVVSKYLISAAPPRAGSRSGLLL
ncbi:hypothetical protein DRH27_02030 [Candidatus Falkowbacteria bacterium]|nr:MAG: hypothetical protein DRH27_02030 [Candidatus Falkowbacteria bacterium]